MGEAFDVITIGTATQDIFYPLPNDNFVFEKGAKADVEAPLYSTGGGAINAGVTFARHGFKTAALFRIGRDEAGAAVTRMLYGEGIVSWGSEDAARATGQGAILLYPGGERVILAHRGAAEDMPLGSIPFARLEARWVYIAPSHIAPDTMRAIIDHCYAQGIKIAFNPSAFYCADQGRLLKPLLSKINILIANREEAALITGMVPTAEKDIFKRLDDLVDGICVMTDGPRGVHTSDGVRIYTAGIFENKQLVSRAGAGDAFGSGFVAGLMDREDIAYAMRFASANATSVTEHMGTHEGVLTRAQFVKDARWKKLNITAS